MIYIWINFSPGYPCCEINFRRTKNLKIARSFCAKVLSRIISIKLFVLWKVLKPLLQKVILKRILRKKGFFNFTKWLIAYETGNPISINKFLKQENVTYSKCQPCKNYFAEVGLERPIFLPCKLSKSRLLNNIKMFLIESTTRRRFSVSLSFFFSILRGKALTRLTKASIIDEKQFTLNMEIKIDLM